MLRHAVAALFLVIIAVLVAAIANTDRATAATAERTCSLIATPTPPPVVEALPVIEPPKPEAPPPIVKLDREVVGTTLTMEVSGYTSEEAQTDGDPCIASDLSDICKRKARGELLCAASREFPLGTKLKIPGLGTCVVADYMPAHRRASADWYFGEDKGKDKTRYNRAMKIDRKQPRQVKILSIPE